MFKSNYVLVTVGHRKFDTGKLVLVKIGGEYTMLDTYKEQAFKIACMNLGLAPSDCKLLSWQFLGDDLTFVM